MRYEEIKTMLLERNYPEGMIDHAIDKARAIPRAQALLPVTRNNTMKRPVCVVSWDPRLPSLLAIKRKHWRSMVICDPYLAKVFPEPPMTAYKIQIKSKCPPKKSKIPQRHISGMKRCNKPGVLCPYIKEGKKLLHNNVTWNINKRLTCESSNIIYLIECNKENRDLKYIGETDFFFKDSDKSTYMIY